MQRSRITFPVQVQQGASGFRLDIVWLDRKRTIENRSCFRISPKIDVAQRNLLEGKEVARIQFESALKISQSLLPLAAPAQDIARHFVNARIVRQRFARDRHLSQSSIIIK